MRRFLITALFVLSFSVIGFGQTKLTEVYVSSEALRVCGPVPNWDITTMTPYGPRFRSKAQAYTRIETYEKVTLSCMQTSLPQYKSNNGYGYVVMAAGSQYGFTADGHPFYLGTPSGQYLRCNNSVLGIWQLENVEEAWTPPTTPRPSPPETHVDYCVNIPDLPVEDAEDEGYDVVKTRRGWKCTEKVTTTAAATATAVAVAKTPECRDGKTWNDKKQKCEGGSHVVRNVLIGAAIGGGAFGIYKIATHHGNNNCNICPQPVPPRKTQTAGQIPNRGGIAGNNGGRIPGAGVPVIQGNGIPTRPRRQTFAPTNGQGSTTAQRPTNGKPPIIM